MRRKKEILRRGDSFFFFLFLSLFFSGVVGFDWKEAGKGSGSDRWMI